MTWVLRLNPMTANAERVNAVAYAETKEQLEAMLEREAVEPYQDGPWHKCFRQGGPLEWFNPPGQDGSAWINVPALVDIGTEADWMKRAADDYRSLLASLCAA